MPLLKDIGANKIATMRPTPVAAYLTNNYMIHDKFMNAIPFTNTGMPTGTGNFQTSYLDFDEAEVTKFRSLGEEYTPNNVEANANIMLMKHLGSSFNTDIAIARSFAGNKNAQSIYEESQLRQHMNSLINSFAKYFFLGDSTKNAKEFDGLNKRLIESQIISTPIDTTDINSNKALKVLNSINEAHSMIYNTPGGDFIIVSTTRGIAKLNTVNAYMYRGVEVIELGSQKYDTFLGRKMIGLADYCFTKEDLAIGEPVYIMHLAEEGGIHTDIPQDMRIVEYLRPTFSNGKVVEQGSIDMTCVPVFPNKHGMVKFYLKDERQTTTPSTNTPSEGTSGTGSTEQG